MILFVFEGEEREPRLYKTLERLYFPRENDNIICSFGNNIYELYSSLEELGEDGDVVSLLRERLSERGDTTLEGIRSSEISQIYLFFDYDFQHTHLPLNEINRRMEVMLERFSDETDNGKLYINYPMIESIGYTKELPDKEYVNYVISREQCRNFKQLVRSFSPYASFDHLIFKEGQTPSKDTYNKIQDNWEILKRMNVCKANSIVNGKYTMPSCIEDICQMKIFRAQKKTYVDALESVSILNSFPIFIFEYRGR